MLVRFIEPGLQTGLETLVTVRDLLVHLLISMVYSPNKLMLFNTLLPFCKGLTPPNRGEKNV